MKEPRYIEALYALAGKNCIGGNADGPISEITFVEDYTPPTEANNQTKLTELNNQEAADAAAKETNKASGKAKLKSGDALTDAEIDALFG